MTCPELAADLGSLVISESAQAAGTGENAESHADSPHRLVGPCCVVVRVGQIGSEIDTGMVFGKRRLDLSAVCQRHGKIEANQWRINASVQRRAIKVDCHGRSVPGHHSKQPRFT
ncbi:hypothetical protein ACU4GD_32185 [Cupriavidus basilensis]